jgi:hypothetical protein
MRNCKICNTEFRPKAITAVTCGKHKCVRANSGSYVKKGFVPIDHKGFETLIRRVRSSLSSAPLVTVIYILGQGFKVVKSINKTTEWMLDTGEALKVGDYVKSVPTLYLIEDFVDMVDEVTSMEYAE